MSEKISRITLEQPADKPYVVTGHRIYMIGAQDGSFPQRGEHMPCEMWGVWLPPVKLFNGFWIEEDGRWIGKADEFVMEPWGCRFFYQNKAIRLERFQWAAMEEAAMALELTVHNLTGSVLQKRFSLIIESNLMPVWLSDRIGKQAGKDKVSFDEKKETVTWQDSENPWSAAMMCSEHFESFQSAEGTGDFPRVCLIPEERRENEKTSRCRVSVFVELAAGETKKISFFFGGSDHSEVEAREQAAALMEKQAELFEEKCKRYTELEQKAALSWPGEAALEEMYRWNQYINDWIRLRVPGVGEGVIAGYPEFPWWFGNDTNYILPALLMQGETELCKETLRLLKRASRRVNGNGRVIHEMSNNGVVFYEGMTTETPQFADSVWQVYCFEGDKAFLKEMYDFCREGMEWISSISEEGLPRGYGISEVAGLDCMCCDTAILAVRGYQVMSRMAEALGRMEDSAYFAEKRARAWETFHREFYIPETGFYGDMVASREEIMERAESWKYSLKSFPITPEDEIMGEASCKQDKSPGEQREKERLRLRMEKIIETAGKSRPGSRRAYQLFGLGHSTAAVEYGYVQGEKARKLLGAQESWQERECFKIDGTMPIALGRQMQAYGYSREPEKVLQALRETAEGFGAVMPGATSEIYPDKGCFVQSWNSFATMWPYLSVIFGVRPDAGNKRLYLRPCICPAIGELSLTQVVIGGEHFSFFLDFEEENGKIKVAVPSDEWKVDFEWEAEDGVRPELTVEVSAKADPGGGAENGQVQRRI